MSIRILASLMVLAACTESKSSDTGKKTDKTEKSDDKTEKGNPKGPRDVDVGDVIDSVKCTSDDSRKGCACLRDFEGAKPFADIPDDGQTVWFGRKYALGGDGDGKKEFLFLQLRFSPASPTRVG